MLTEPEKRRRLGPARARSTEVLCLIGSLGFYMLVHIVLQLSEIGLGLPVVKASTAAIRSLMARTRRVS